MPYVIKLNSHKITEEYQTEAMVGALQYLIKEHALLENISLPYTMQKKAFLNTSPTHPDDTEMGQYAVLAEDLCLNVNVAWRTKVNQLKT